MKQYDQMLQQQLQKKDGIGSAFVFEGEKQGTYFLFDETEICAGQKDAWTTNCFDLVKEQKNGAVVHVEDNAVFVEQFSGIPRWVILGGGHISLALADLGKLLGFHVTVVDDRKEFVNRERFPQVDCLICDDFDCVFDKIPDFSQTYYIVVTRGHQADSICAKQICKRKYAYFGMIGSRAKVAKTKENLLAAGVLQKQIDTLHAPIGLPIGAVTPEEIAVCIAAEIIQVKNRKPRKTISDEFLQTVCTQKSGVVAVIVEKDGSAPREAGARMFVQNGHIVCGTIGGGAIEQHAIKHCAEMQQQQNMFDVQRYVLHNKDSASLGMICGGSNMVFFYKI